MAMPTNNEGRTGQRLVVLSTIVIGGVIATSGLVAGRRSATESDDIPVGATAEYGRQLLRETSALLGPDQPDPDKRYAGNRLDCASCHLDTGTEPGTLSLLAAAANYPRFSGREGGEEDLRLRINGCMERSMNGRPLPRNSPELIAMEAYILTLQAQFDAMGEGRRAANTPTTFKEPDRAADVRAGRLVYEERCQVCHGKDGEGLMATEAPRDGYLFPPLWGPDSFNNGAGMNRVLTAARFIKARMPLGAADLTDDQAFDVAAYVSSRPRPQMDSLELDYPDRKLKPVDGPYPPYADPFPIEQHRIGPFGPIRAFYKPAG